MEGANITADDNEGGEIRLLVTGASGMLGSTVARRGAAHYSVAGTYLTREIDFPEVDEVMCDLTETSQVNSLEGFDPDAIVHCAAQTDVDRCEREPDTAEETNIRTSENIARLAAKVDAKLIHISTDAVFNGEGRNYSEDDDPDPRNVYGQTKLESESKVLDIHNDTVVVRTCIYGWNPISGQSIAEWMLSRLKNGEIVPAFKDAYFTPIYVGNLTTCLLELLEKDYSGVLHIAGNTRCSKLEFAHALADIFELDADLIQSSSIKSAGFDAPRGHDLSLSTQKAQKRLDCSLPTLQEGLHNMKSDQNEW